MSNAYAFNVTKRALKELWVTLALDDLGKG